MLKVLMLAYVFLSGVTLGGVMVNEGEYEWHISATIWAVSSVLILLYGLAVLFLSAF